MAWISIEEADVQSRLAAAELSALKTVALADGQTSPLTDVIAHVVDEIRGYVAACAANTLGEGAVIPQKLLSAALAMIRFRLATRLPRFPLDENRRRENDQALRLLEQVAACKFAIEEPATAEDEAVSSPSPSIFEASRTFKRTDQDGI
jgi:hypothetical protein